MANQEEIRLDWTGRPGHLGHDLAKSSVVSREWDSVFFPVQSIAGFRVWLLGQWVEKPCKVWNGSTWVVKPVKRWNSVAWV